MKRSYLLVLGLLALSCSLVWGATGLAPPDFRGIPWGGAVTEALVKTDAAGATGTVEVYRNKSKELKPYLGVPITDEAYYFARGKLTGGLLFCKGEVNFTKLKDSLTTLYGPPENPKPEFYVWQWTQTQALISIAYNKKFQYTTVSTTSGTSASSGAAAKKKTR